MKKENNMRGNVTGVFLIIMVFVMILLGGGKVSMALENSTEDDTYQNDTSLNVSDEETRDVEQDLSAQNDTSEVQERDEGFRLEIKLSDSDYLSESEGLPLFYMNETIMFNTNITLYGVEVYSIDANVSITEPGNKTRMINKSQDKTYDFYFSPDKAGEHMISLKSRFKNTSYQEIKYFAVLRNHSDNISVYFSQEHVSVNTSGTNITGANITVGIISEENMTGRLNASLSYEIQSYENKNLSVNPDNRSNITHSNDGMDDVEEGKKTVAQDREKTLSYLDSGYNLTINMRDRYYYEHGPILITGNASSFVSGEEGDRLPFAMDLHMEIYPENNFKKRISCSILANGSSEFFCEVKGSLIELTDYVVEFSGNYAGEHFFINDSFELALFETEEISLEIDHDDVVKASEKQVIIVNATRGEKSITGADVGIQIIDPDEVVYSIASQETGDGLYSAEFYGLEEGNHTIKATLVKASEFKTGSSSFTIEKPDFDIDIGLPETIYHSSGRLDIEGSLNITLDNKSIDSDVSISVYSEDTLKKNCLLYCEGACNFTCSMKNYIEFTGYRLYATVLYDLFEYSEHKDFEVKFREIDLDLEISHKEMYKLNEPQEYIIDAYDRNTKQRIKGATIYVKVTDPDENVYRIIPIPVENGRYSFEFVGAIPGKYNLSITFIKDALYSKKNLSVNVSTEKFSYSDRYEKNLTLVQLPAEVGKNVRWIREVYLDNMSRRGKKVIIHKEAENLKINNQVKRDIKLSWKDKNITYDSFEKLNEIKKLRSEYERLEEQKKKSGMIERIGITNRIENKISKSERLKKELSLKEGMSFEDINITTDPAISLENMSGYNIISYETPPPKKTEKEGEDGKKLVTVSSGIHYEDVIVSSNVTETYKENIRLYWLKGENNERRELFKDIDYIDADNDGLIDTIRWVVPHLSDQTFEVVILLENKSFEMDGFKAVPQYSLAKFVAKPNWPSIEHKEDYSCTFFVDDKSREMIYDNGVYEFYHEFNTLGSRVYKILCGDQAQEGRVEVIRSSDIPSRRTRFSKTYFYSDLFYVTDSHLKPVNYLEGTQWKTIDSRFIPQKNSYSIARGLFSVRLDKDVNASYLMEMEQDGYRISSKPSAIVYYDASTDAYAYLLEHNSLNDVNVYKQGKKVIYRNYFDYASLVYDYENEKIKQYLELSPDTIGALPNPGAFGFDEASTYVMLETRLKTDNIFIPETDENDVMRLSYVSPAQGAGNISSQDGQAAQRNLSQKNIYLDKDYFYPLSGESTSNVPRKEEMFRKIRREESGLVSYSGIPYSEMMLYRETGVVFDPAFSIIDTASDAMSIDNTIKTDYYDEDSRYLFFGKESGEIYQAGLKFELDVPKNATIVSAYITLSPGANMSNGTFSSNISVQDTDNAPDFSAGAGSISSVASYYEDAVSWQVSNWSLEYNYSTSDISHLVELVVNRSGWAKGNSIAFMIDEGNASGEYRSFHDFSTPDSEPAVLTVVYRAEESRPVVMLDYPSNNSYISTQEVEFNFTPSDSEGLDSCMLYTNSTGEWHLNQTLDDVENDAMNNFSSVIIQDGRYIWNVKCNDTMGNEKFNITDFEFTVDTVEPLMTLESPAEDDELSSFNTSFNFTVEDDGSPNVSCDIIIDGITNISDIVINNSFSSDDHSEAIENISAGRHNWSVSCEDLAGNSRVSDANNFTISRFTNLTIWDDADYYSNFSRGENVSFYANFTDKGNTSIDDADCTVSFDTSDSFSMPYTNNLLYENETSFNVSGFIGYNVSCTHLLYDDALASENIYIYPKVNASIEKKISLLSPKRYNISIEFKNRANYPGYVKIVDFVSRFFDTSFSVVPDGVEEVDGTFFGRSYYWKYYLDSLQEGRVHYVVEANESYYRVVELYLVGFEASDS